MNNWRQLGEWDFLDCRDPQQLGRELKSLIEARDARIRDAATPLREDATRDM